MQHRSSPNARTQRTKDRGQPDRTPWSDLFARSTVHPRMFYLKGSRGRHADISNFGPVREAVIDLDIPHRFGSRRGVWDWWEHGGAGFLDGGLFQITGGDGFGFGGVYILGADAFRLVCHETAMVPPRRLKGEDRTPPSHKELLAMLTEQLEDPETFAHLRLVADTLWSSEMGPDVAAVLNGTARLHRYGAGFGDLTGPVGPEDIVDEPYVSPIRKPKPKPVVKREPPKPEPEPSIAEVFLCLTCADMHGHHRDKELRCRCQPHDDEWRETNFDGWDIAETLALCTMCCMAAVKSGSRWSWLGCESCREASEAIGTGIAGKKAGIFRFGRHSIMNGISLSPLPEKTEESVNAIMTMLKDQQEMGAWQKVEIARLAAFAGFEDDVPLEQWTATFRPSLGNSLDAMCRHVGVDIHDAPNGEHLVKAWEKRDKTITKDRNGG
jgi:hypothetical protein